MRAKVMSDLMSAYRERTHESRKLLVKANPEERAQFEQQQAEGASKGLVEETLAHTLLETDFNPRCEPLWTDQELAHKIDDAINQSALPWGYLLDAVTPSRRAL